MVHVHGAKAQRLVAQTRGIWPDQLVAVPIDVGKHTAMALICDFTGELLVGPFQFAMTRPGVSELVRRVEAVRPSAQCGWSGLGSKLPGTTIGR